MLAAASDPSVRTVVRSSAVTVDVGADRWTDDGWVDISEDLLPEGQVECDSFRTIHRTCKVRLSRGLDWGKDRLRLRMRLTSAEGTFEVPVGVFLLSTPSARAGESPTTFEVEGYDLLEVLDQPHGAAVVAAAGTGYLASARTLIEAAGLQVTFADEQKDRLLGQNRVWPLDQRTTTLQIVNELLAAVGFRKLHIGANGTARSQPLTPLSERGTEWVYDASAVDTTVGEFRTGMFDFFDVPNRLVAVSDDPEAGLSAVTLNNVSDGPTSQDGRGRVITAVERFEAADAAALEAQAADRFDELSNVAEEFSLQVSPNPTHFYRDVVRLVDPDLGASVKCVVRRFTLPLDGSDMQLELRAVR